MTIRLDFFIGSDETGVITLEYEQKIKVMLSKRWKSFTLTKGRGCYNGKMEDMITAVIFTPQLLSHEFYGCIEELKIELKQKEIGYDVNLNSNFQTK